ncbi:hypothetical protein RZS08_02030, partial [Arthrospira platensis SPKY1]|nr:hypothetical protein [Arthrospira platensis SPKY1]
GPSFYEYRPYPYYAYKDGTFRLQPPAFQAPGLWALHHWREGAPSYREKVRHALTDGYRVEIIHYYNCLWARIKIGLGLIPGPAKKKFELECYFYDRAIAQCKKHGAVP